MIEESDYTFFVSYIHNIQKLKGHTSPNTKQNYNDQYNTGVLLAQFYIDLIVVGKELVLV